MEAGPRKFKILLIDDEKSVLFALKLLLEALGFDVIDFNAADEALVFLTTAPECDLCICDLKMPKMSGLQVLEQARQLSPHIPFVLMSAHANQEEVGRAKSLGAHGFLAKPFTPEQLKAVVAEIEAKKI